ncbi:putative pentatricopeptide repeat-containing protein [Nymphaea thermarum]|nr:putative pentatricopeptide repeat-containing protein [Nymphaea thermarum]
MVILIFDNMEQAKVEPDLATMIKKCGCLDGHDCRVWNAQVWTGSHEVFDEMRSSRTGPNDVNVISVSSACADAGLASHGLNVFKRIQQDYCLKPRAGHHVVGVCNLVKIFHM